MSDTYLNKNTQLPNGFYTHVSMFTSRKYNIIDQQWDEMIRLYSKESGFKCLQEVTYCNNAYVFSGLTFMVDVDLSIPLDISTGVTELYSENDVLMLYDVLRTNIRKHVSNVSFRDLDFVLQEKEMRTDKQRIKHGFHCRMVNVIIPGETISLIMKDVIDDMKDYKFLVHKYTPNTLVKDIIDSKAGHINHRLMHGSSKNPEAGVYLPTRVFTVNEDDGIDEEDMEDWFTNQTVYTYDSEFFRFQELTKKISLEEKMCRVLSANPFGRPLLTPKKKVFFKVVDEEVSVRPPISQKEREDGLKVLSSLIDIIPASLADSFSDWSRIGLCMYNMTGGCDEGLDYFLKFSMKCMDKYDEHGCRDSWKRFGKSSSRLGMNTIINDIRSRTKIYEDVLFTLKANSEHNITNTLRTASRNSNTKFANMYLMCTQKLITTAVRKSACGKVQSLRYIYNRGLRWESDEGFDLHEDIRLVLLEKVRKAMKFVKKCFKQRQQGINIGEMFKEQPLDNIADDYLEDEPDEISKADTRTYEKHLSNLIKLEDCCDDTIWIDRILNAVNMASSDKDFLNNIDNDDYKYATQNGILNLKSFKFEADSPANNTIHYSPCSYRSYYSENHPDVIEYRKFMSQSFPYEEEREYRLLMWAIQLLGFNPFDAANFTLSRGQTGKSVQLDIQIALHGKDPEVNYGVSIPSQALYQMSSGNNDYLLSLKHKRYGFVDEFDEATPIGLQMFKKIMGSSGDNIMGKFKSPEYVVIKNHWEFSMNTMIPLFNFEFAGMRRIGVLFASRSTFNSNPPKSLDEQKRLNIYPCDVKYKDAKMINMLAHVRLWDSFNILKRRYDRLGDDWLYSIKNEVPQSLIDYKKSIIEEKSAIFKYLNIKITKDDNGFLSWDILCESYKSWYRVEYKNGNKPCNPPQQDSYLKDDFHEYLRSKDNPEMITVNNQSGWNGWSLNI